MNATVKIIKEKSSIVRAIRYLSNLGCGRGTSIIVQNQTRLVNNLCMTVMTSAILFAAALYSFDVPMIGVLTVFLVAPLKSVALLLNARYMHSLAQRVDLILSNLIVLSLCITFGEKTHFQYFYIVLLGLPLVVFSHSRSNVKWRFLFLAFGMWVFAEGIFASSTPFVFMEDNRTELIRFICNGLQFTFVGCIFYFFSMESDQHLQSLRNQKRQLILSNQQLDDALEKAQSATKAKSMFLANMSHEIRTPLNGILVASDILGDASLPAKEKELVDIIQTSSTNLLGLVSDILDLSKAEANKVKLTSSPFDLRRVVNETMLSIQHQAALNGVAVHTYMDEAIDATYIGDEQKLRQVLNNLLGNSVKFCKDGQISLSVKPLSAAGGKTKLEFCVEDTGIGIPDEKLPEIFDSFSQVDNSPNRTNQGTGLGTTISKMLVELMGGEIRVDSPNPRNTQNNERGTVFTFTICLENTPAEKAPEDVAFVTVHPATKTLSNPAENAVEHLRILVAEDNPINQQVASHLFNSMGCLIDIASDGAEAIEKISTKTYDLVFMDQMMPNKDGLAATAELRKKGYSMPIIALTANTLTEDRQACIDAGMNDYLTKPVIREELEDMLVKWGVSA